MLIHEWQLSSLVSFYPTVDAYNTVQKRVYGVWYHTIQYISRSSMEICSGVGYRSRYQQQKSSPVVLGYHSSLREVEERSKPSLPVRVQAGLCLSPNIS